MELISISARALPPASETLPSTWKLGENVQWVQDRVVIGMRRSTLELSVSPATDESFDLYLQKDGPGNAIFTFHSGSSGDAGQFELKRDKFGDALNLYVMERDPDKGTWRAVPGATRELRYRPVEGARLLWTNLAENGLEPKGWRDRPVKCRMIQRDQRVEFFIDGTLAYVLLVSESESVSLRMELAKGDAVKPTSISKWKMASRFQPLLLGQFAAEATDRVEESDILLQKDGIPFLVPLNGKGSVDLRKTCWPLARIAPSSYYSPYDAGMMFLGDARTPIFSAPAEDYTALHLLVRKAPSDQPSSNRFSVRLGHFSARGQVLYHDYHAEVGDLPGEQVISVPITEILAQDLTGSVPRTMHVAVNKEIRLARRSPDPNRFQYRPIGLPPNVALIGATLERSKVQLRVTGKEAGNIFEGTKTAQFTAGLHNISDKSQAYVLTVTSVDAAGNATTQTIEGTIEPGERRDIRFDVAGKQWGYFKLGVELKIAGGGHPLTRQTTFATLPPDTRKHRESSPFGTWTFGGAHFTCQDPDVLGVLLKKAGLRFGMGRFTAEERAKWGVRQNYEAKGIDKKEKYQLWQEKNPDALPVVLLLHEGSISADHSTRIPDIFTGREPYKLSADEQKRFDGLREGQIKSAKIMREHFPKVSLQLGNGPLLIKEELLRSGYPAELFDTLGNEAGSFARLPEAQPPDWIANNASIWMDHELLKAYGYADKEVVQCYEIMYPSTNPGNLSSMDQAAYFLRHALHSLAWGMPVIRFGCLEDCGSSYRFSNWGGSGLLHAYPELNPKPAYVAVATMTRVLDGAKYVRTIETPSRSVYVVEFKSPHRGNVYALWGLRGQREIEVALSGAGWTLTNWEGNEQKLSSKDGIAIFGLSSMPVFLTGNGQITHLTLKDPHYAEKPGETAEVVAKLDSLEDWICQTERDGMLENYNPLTPRRQGSFDYKAIEDTALAASVIEVVAKDSPGAEVLPMYGALKAKVPILLPGQPSEIGLWVDGNSGWGRIIFEIEDAKGEKWTSIGASQKGEISEWMLDWLPKEFAETKGTATRADWNTNDTFGQSAINFDGWRFLRFPLPGNYPNAEHPWPANSQWRSDGDGVVDYPVKLTRLIFEFPKNVLKLTDYRPVPAAEHRIRIRNLTVESGTQGGIKEFVREN